MRGHVLVVVLAIACGPRSPRPPIDEGVPWARSGVDWTKPPAAMTVAWTPPPIAEATLPNGVRLLVVENHRLPIVAISAVHGAAGSREDGAHPGVAALTADVMDEAAGDLSTSRLARALDSQGTRLDTSIATDHATHQLVTRARELRTALGLLADIVQRPRLADADVERVRALRVAALTEQRTQTRRIAAQVFDRVVFGTHPYAEPSDGTPATMAALTVSDVRAFWQRAYRPDALTLIVAGDVTPAQARDVLAATFGDWKAPAVPRPTLPALPAYTAQLAYVDVPGATEVNVIIGQRAPAAGDPQQLAADLTNTIVGSGTEGRLDRELHGKLQLTYGASASFWRGELAGTWAAASTFATARAAEGIRAMIAAIARLPTDDEIALARRNLLAAAQLSFETTLGTVRAVERLVAQRQPLDAFATLQARVASASPGELPTDALSIVVVGDWSRLAEPLRALGLPATQYKP